MKGIKAFLEFLGEILVYTPRKLCEKSEFTEKNRASQDLFQGTFDRAEFLSLPPGGRGTVFDGGRRMRRSTDSLVVLLPFYQCIRKLRKSFSSLDSL